MTDRELLELAAKAAGIEGKFKSVHQPYGDVWIEGIDTGARFFWNPLTDDGAALRLAVKLRLGVCVTSGLELTSIDFYHHPGDFFGGRVPYIKEDHEGDEFAATRRAIVRAAAEIGKGK